MNNIDYFNSVAQDRAKWRKKYYYFHHLFTRYMKFHVPEDSSVLDIGCETGELLHDLKPSNGMGIDISENMINIAKEKFPHLHFCNQSLEDLQIDETFDYIVLSNTIGYFSDIQESIQQFKGFCHPRSRVIVTTYNQLWQPVLKLAEGLGLRMHWPEKHWLSPHDIEGLFKLEDFELIKKERKILFPLNIPLISAFFNKFLVNLPIFRHLALVTIMIFRPVKQRKDPRDVTCTIVVPCRNEKGTIEQAVTRMPKMGPRTEIIFIEGGSQDGTYEECLKIKEKYPGFDIKVMQQKGKGKGNAVRESFAAATGDVLMILDADLTVPPEDLIKFYEAIVSSKGEFINGSRLVYKMEKKAMRFLNLVANKSFSVILTYLVGQYLKDTLCGTKVLWREDYKLIEKGRSYFGEFDPFGDFDLLFGAAKLNLKIAEIPIHYKDRVYGSTQISRFRHGWLLIQMTLFAARKIKFL
ncbi:MAG: glycosyltransferase [Candidatus Omnitrophica bacterium]|nr:glycosyltransferase [Candidatus Omnitrophota bacterium]